MSPTRRDILKAILAATVVPMAPATLPVTAADLPNPRHKVDSDSGVFDVRQRLDAYCPQTLEGVLAVYDPHTKQRKYLKIDFFCGVMEDAGRSEIRLSSFVDDHESVTIGSSFTVQRRLMVALAGFGEGEA